MSSDSWFYVTVSVFNIEKKKPKKNKKKTWETVLMSYKFRIKTE